MGKELLFALDPTYSDEMILDVVLSKYCDLIPIERYVGMADRSGLKDLPPHSLIDFTHKFADFIECVYELIKKGVLKARVLNADETPHFKRGSCWIRPEHKSWSASFLAKSPHPAPSDIFKYGRIPYLFALASP